MLQFKKSVLEFQFENSLVSVRFPTMKELNNFRKKQKDSPKDDEDISSLIEFIVSLGMPESICDQLEPWMFKQILDELIKDKGDLTKKN